MKPLFPISFWLRHNVALPHESTPQLRPSDLLSRKTQFQCRLTPAGSASSAAAETKSGDCGSLCLQGIGSPVPGQPGGKP